MDWPWGNIITGLCTVFAVVVANLLTTRNTRGDQLHELRRVAYGKIIRDLGVARRGAKLMLAELDATGDGFYGSPSGKKLLNDFSQHFNAATVQVAEDYIILSDRFIALHEELIRQVNKGVEHARPPREAIMATVTGLEETYPKLLELAREEIKNRHRRWSGW